MKKSILALVIFSLVGCGNGDSPTPPSEEFDSCTQVKLPSRTILPLEVIQEDDGTIKHGYFKNEIFVYHRDCRDEPAVERNSLNEANYFKEWFKHGNYERENDLPTYTTFSGSSDYGFYLQEEWRSGSWPKEYYNDGDSLALRPYLDRVDKPNVIASFAYENGNVIATRYYAYMKSYYQHHREGAPSTAHFDIDGSLNKETWYDDGQMIKEKHYGSSNQYPYGGQNHCNWYIDKQGWYATIETDGSSETGACRNEDENDSNYLVWGDTPIGKAPIEERTYEFFELAGINREQVDIICRGDDVVRVDCSNTSDDWAQIIHSPVESESIEFIENNVKITSQRVQFDYNISLNYEDNVWFEFSRKWEVLTDYSTLEIGFFNADEYNSNNASSIAKFFDSQNQFIHEQQSYIYASTDQGYNPEESNIINLLGNDLSVVMNNEIGKVAIKSGAYPILDDTPNYLNEDINLDCLESFYANAFARAKVFYELRH
ncbi:hypothetical protein FB440_101136 [Vibrio crassostreae]|uniref:hypothetical protein n=1 Tax=Vibrio crassostreae TaxID=246167 RepID=UPI00119C0149|nr:hypothetical protein [Vibrio crassostreae]TWD43223.1 hypothetical protein FB440_101136 [Vibrio crassostreae]